jgi:hypothetical protein
MLPASEVFTWGLPCPLHALDKREVRSLRCSVQALEAALVVVVGDGRLQLREGLVAAHRALGQLSPALAEGLGAGQKGRVGAALAGRASHRSGRARLRHPVRQLAALLGGSDTSTEARRPPRTLASTVTVTGRKATRDFPWCPMLGPQASTPLPLHRLLRVEFPCCIGTMRVCDSLRSSRPTPLPSRSGTTATPEFRSRRRERARAGPGVGKPVPHRPQTVEDVRPPRFPGNPVVPMPCSPTPAGPTTPGLYGASAWPPLCPQRRLPRQCTFRGSIARPGDWLSTLRPVGHPTRRKTRFWLLAKLCQAGLVTRRVSLKGFRTIHPPFRSFAGRKVILNCFSEDVRPSPFPCKPAPAMAACR